MTKKLSHAFFGDKKFTEVPFPSSRKYTTALSIRANSVRKIGLPSFNLIHPNSPPLNQSIIKYRSTTSS